MSDMQNILDVSIEINGIQRKVGCISGNTPDGASFSYAEDYLSGKDLEGAKPYPISIHLPLREEPFSPEITKVFFEGLLPEGFTRRSVAQWMRVDENDYLSILEGLGNECLGAIRISKQGADAPVASYQKLRKNKIRALAAEGAASTALYVTESRLSLTGASGKVGLYYDEGKDAWYQPTGNAPSTHIVKQSHVRLGEIVLNEQLTLKTAEKLGIDVSPSFIINLGDGNDEDVLLAIKRYDRDMNGVRDVDGLICPLRRHQEDMAQALGISPQLKYEGAGENYLAKVAQIILRHSSNPIVDIRKLWDITVYNWLIGNTDNHIKNLSLLYSPNLGAASLAPAYDLVSTIIYPSVSRDMAMSIGGVFKIDDIGMEEWAKSAAEIGMGRGLALDRIDEMREKFEPALKESAKELAAEGFSQARKMSNKILKNRAMRTVPMA